MTELWQRVLAAHIPAALWWVIGPFILWRSGLRVYRLLARQTFDRTRSWTRAGSLGGLTLLVAAVAFEERTAAYSLALGLALGAALGLLGTRFSALYFERWGTQFQPDPVTGAALSMLLVGRIGWRLVAGPAGVTDVWTLSAFVRNPSTMLLFGLFSAHYVVYSLALVRAVHRHGGTDADPATAPSDDRPRE